MASNPTEDNSSNHSDSDDWTLVSPPHSSVSSSPAREDLLEAIEDSPLSDNSGCSNSSLVHLDEDDGLTEIDLSGASKSQTKTIQPIVVTPASGEPDERFSSAELAEQGFQPLDTTTDDEDNDDYDESSSEGDSRRSSLTQSELGEYVDLGRRDDDDTVPIISSDPDVNNQSTLTLAPQSSSIDDQAIISDGRTAYQNACLLSLKTKLDELSDAASRLQRDRITIRSSPASSFSSVWRVPIKQWILLHLVLMTVHIITNYILHTYVVTQPRPQDNYHHNNEHPALDAKKSENNNLPQFLRNLMDNFEKNIPTSQQYVELQLLHSELNQCIKRQSPSSYKYYISEERFKEHSTSQQQTKNYKPYRGLVCYGQEAQWRKRFEKLKSKYNLDLRKFMLDAKKRVTNELLEFYHPSLQFKLILNQIEYLDFIENKRKEKQTEDLVMHLKAENLQLLRRLNHPNETGIQKSIINLELKNSRLQRENEVLKENLGQKAGPTYIKQSLELEQYERENTILKQFHYQIAHDISKSLKQFNLHTIDASTILDDQESLNSQLMLTRGYLRRLREKISTILIENEGLKEELKEIYLLSVTNKANLPATHDKARHNNIYSNTALQTDNCTRTLKEIKDKNGLLESELEALKRNCSGGSSGLEKCSSRHLNRTSEASFHDRQSNLEFKQLGALQTAVDKHAKDALALRHHDDIIDELMVLLTKFNNQIESNGLAIFDQDQLHHNNAQENTAGYLGSDKLTTGEEKVIPNYIREAVRTDTLGCVASNCKKMPAETSKQASGELPPAQLPTFYNSNASQAVIDDESVVHHRHLEETHSQEATKQNNIVESKSNNILHTRVANTWLFKRAKQRKQLRNRREVIKPQTTDWLMKRAKLREKLREATSYVEDSNNAASNDVKHKKKDIPDWIHCLSRKPFDCINMRFEKHAKSKGYKQRKNRHNHHKQQRHANHKRYYRDEL